MTRNPRYLKESSGFTLIEIILAITILAFIFVITYSALTAIITTKKALDDSRDVTTVASSVLTRLGRELQLAYAQSPLMPPRDRLDQFAPPRINLRGESKLLDSGKHGDSLTFLALEGGQYLPDGGTHSGLVQITYRIEHDPENPKADTYSLVREETPYTRPFDKAYQKSMIFPITDSLISLHFRYFSFDAQEWSTTWGDDKNNGLPSIIALTVVLRSPNGKNEEYSTSVALQAKRDS